MGPVARSMTIIQMPLSSNHPAKWHRPKQTRRSAGPMAEKYL